MRTVQRDVLRRPIDRLQIQRTIGRMVHELQFLRRGGRYHWFAYVQNLSSV